MKLQDALLATYDVIGQPTNAAAVALMTEELTSYPRASVDAALARCRRELRRITLADILDRLPGGHPGAEEAWAIVARSMTDEACTIVWSEEMREAFGEARKLADNAIAARQAFKELYVRLVSESRSQRKAPRWSISLGTSLELREAAIVEGMQKGRLLPEQAMLSLPFTAQPSTLKKITAAILEAVNQGRLSADEAVKLLPTDEATAEQVATLCPRLLS